jgi:hypothetical protein
MKKARKKEKSEIAKRKKKKDRIDFNNKGKCANSKTRTKRKNKI